MARKAAAKTPKEKKVEALTHEQARRKNIPTAEHQSLAQRQEEQAPVGPIRYSRVYPLKAGTERNRDKDIDPQIVWNGARIRLTKEQIRQLQEKGEIEIGDAQLVWRGKDQQDWSDLVVNAPPLYIQEKVHPKAIIDDLVRQSKKAKADNDDMPDLFSDFNGLDNPEARTEFYQHSQHWSNRMILGDSLQVMASLAEREHLRGQVQCIYFDPPYGIKFNSNWQVSTRTPSVKDGKQAEITREPEQVKAFRDTWKDGIHSYLTYLRDRITVMRDLLHDSGSIFLQIGDENVHRVRAVLDEVFGEENFVSQIAFAKTTGLEAKGRVSSAVDYLLWFAKSADQVKYRPITLKRSAAAADRFSSILLIDGDTVPYSEDIISELRQKNQWHALVTDTDLTKPGPGAKYEFSFKGQDFESGERWWGTQKESLERVGKANRLLITGRGKLRFARREDDSAGQSMTNIWSDIGGAVQSRSDPKVYVVQTGTAVVQRCLLMTTDPGDLVLDPTCGSGTTAMVAEQWGRRWITADTSRVALALARTRLMSARYPYYLLADSKEGRVKEQEITGKLGADTQPQGDVRLGFVCERAPEISLKTVGNNTAIDAIYDDFQRKLDPILAELNKALSKKWQEWDVPCEVDPNWPDTALRLHASWWETRVERQRKIDASIAKAADVEMLYDRPYEDKSRVRVAGPFTVESLSPHRVVPADEDMLAEEMKATGKRRRSKLMAPPTDFAQMVLEHLRTAGVHQAEKRDTIRFTSLTGWPGEYVCAEAHFREGETQRRAAVFLGPEFGTLSRVDLVAAAREATEARFDVLIACSFNFDAHASELTRLGPLPILKAKMNPDLHMADELKNTGKGNLFVVFGEPDIDILDQGDETIVVKVNGIDVFDPNTGQIRSNDVKGIAAWFIDTDYNEESFFVRHAYFLGANDPYKSLKTALRAEINPEAWETLYRDTSRPFPRPSTGRIAVKVINHFGDEVMKVYQV